MKKNKGTLFVISAPSGAGKTTLVNNVVDRLTGVLEIKRVITYTSKRPRTGEVDGVDYHFVSEADFVQKIEQDFFVEHSTAYHAYYGFPKDLFQRIEQGEHYIAIVDRAGAASLKTYWQEAVLIWIQPPDKEALAHRLIARGQDSREQIAMRLSLAEQEIALLQEDDLFEYLIVNDSLDAAVEQLESIIKGII